MTKKEENNVMQNLSKARNYRRLKRSKHNQDFRKIVLDKLASYGYENMATIKEHKPELISLPEWVMAIYRGNGARNRTVKQQIKELTNAEISEN